MHLHQLVFIRGRGRGSRVPTDAPEHALSGVTPQSIPLGDGADVYLTERGREGMERRWNRKEQKEEKCLHSFYQSFLVSHISPATPGKEVTD